MSLNTYQENRILGASPVELVQILYRGAFHAVLDAKEYLRAGEIASRSRQISKAQMILLELASSIDTEKGGALALRLLGLYAYMQERLTTANMEQTEAPLAEVASLLTTVLDGWEQCAAEDYRTARESVA